MGESIPILKDQAMNELEKMMSEARRKEDSKSLDSFLIFILVLFVCLFVIVPIIAFKGYIEDKQEREVSKVENIGDVK